MTKSELSRFVVTLIRRSLIILAISSALSACVSAASAPMPTATPNPPGWIIDWLKNPVCTPPCWQGIQPGVTSKDSVEDIQRQFPDMSLETRRGTSIVQLISLNLPMDDHLPIGLIVSKYGQPSYVRLYKCDPNARCETHIVFPDLGMALDAYPDNIGAGGHNAVRLSDNTSIFRIYLLEPGIASYHASFNGGPDEGLIRWTGYHEYSNP